MEIIFKQEKTTKNTIKFAEQLADELDTPKIGSLYIQKAALKELGWQDGKLIKVDLNVTDA